MPPPSPPTRPPVLSPPSPSRRARPALPRRRCTKLRALALTHYSVNDVPDVVLDVRHLPLRVAALLQSLSGCSMEVLLPAGVQALTLGQDDLHVLHQPGVADKLRVLKLPQASGLDVQALNRLPLDGVRRVHVATWHLTPATAARLGQRCAHADIVFEPTVRVDVATDYFLL